MIESVGGVVDELLAALDTLSADELAPLFGPVLLDRLRPLLVAQNRLAAEIARTVRECEVSGAAEHDGLEVMTSWLRGHGHLSVAEAARVVRTGRALEHLPAMAEAFAAGALTGEQAATLGRAAEPEHLARAADQDVDLAAADAVLTEVAITRPHADTARPRPRTALCRHEPSSVAAGRPAGRRGGNGTHRPHELTRHTDPQGWRLWAERRIGFTPSESPEPGDAVAGCPHGGRPRGTPPVGHQ